MKQGICALSNIPVRKEDSSMSEMVSMLLFGETYKIQQTKGDWTQIIIDDDGYEGWINNKQVTSFDQSKNTTTVLRNFPCAICQNENNSAHFLLPGSQIMNLNDDVFQIGADKFTLIQHPQSPTPSIIDLALGYLNAPYLWGGKSLFGIDCSGFTQVVYKMYGVQLKRDAYQQAEMGVQVDFRESVMPGDLAFFDNAEGKITHVGIMITPNKIIHASGKVRIDEIDNFGIINADIKEYSHKLRIIKRILS